MVGHCEQHGLSLPEQFQNEIGPSPNTLVDTSNERTAGIVLSRPRAKECYQIESESQCAQVGLYTKFINSWLSSTREK